MTYEILNRSADMRFFRLRLIQFSVLGFLYILIAVIAAIVSPAILGVVAVALVMNLGFFVPYLVYYTRSILEIRKNLEAYTVHTVTLTHAHKGVNHRMFFVVELTDGEGRILAEHTKSIFGTSLFDAVHFADYNGKEVQVAYNAVTDQLVVLDGEKKA